MLGAWRTVGIRLAVGALLVTAVLGGWASARADDAEDSRELVERARFTLERFHQDSGMDGFRALMRERARAVLILPQVIRIGFIAGGSGGSGVLMAHSPQGEWLGPSFYTLYQMNLGILAGAEATEMVILALTEKGLTSLLSTTMKWGADVSGAVGPVGMGAAAASAGLSADLVVYSRGKGLYLSFSLDGAVLDVRETLNGAYYGRSATPIDILVRGEVANPHAKPLADLLKKLATGQP
ncbi:MAG: lipid-binding SYLF domain-containing protein [Candidatus Methylomirabilota bacterium]